MAYVGKTNLEDVASAIQNLRWHEMVRLGQYLADVEAPPEADRDFWSAIINDWAAYKIDEYDARVREEKAKEQALKGTANG